MAHSSSTIREIGPPNPPNVIRRNLRNALRNNALAHRIDASPSAENAELFSEFLKSALINLETNETIFDAVIPNVSVEEAARLEPLRLANQTALEGVRAIQDADKKARAAARRAEKKPAKQAILDTEPSHTPTTTTDTPLHAPGVRLTKSGRPKNKPGPKPGSHRTPKAEKPNPTEAETEQQRARGVGQPEALALLAEHFASSPVRQLSPLKRKAIEEEEVDSSAQKFQKRQQSATPAEPKDKSKAEMRAIKKMKKSRLSKETNVGEEAPTAAPATQEEAEETHTSPNKRQKKSKLSREEQKGKRKSDVSMKDATPITSPVTTPIPTSTSKSRSEKGRYADKFHPYKKTGKHNEKHKEKEEEEVGKVGDEEVHETEDITAEVDEKMRRHRARVEKDEKARELGINPGEKHKRESLGMSGPSPKHSRDSIQDHQASGKKRKTKKSKEEEEEVKFKGVVGDIERKRKSPSPDLGNGESVVESKGRSAEEKRKRKEVKAEKRARQQSWKGARVDGMGDVVMGGGVLSE